MKKVYNVYWFFGKLEFEEANIVKETSCYYFLDKYLRYSKRIEKEKAHLTLDEAFNFALNYHIANMKNYQRRTSIENEIISKIQKARAKQQPLTNGSGAPVAPQPPAQICPHYFEATDGVHVVVVGRCRCAGKLPAA